MPEKKTDGRERRNFQVTDLRVDHGGDDDGASPVIRGHAAVFNTPSSDFGGFTEIVAPGAFTDTLKSGDVRALFNHDPNLILGRNGAGTLRLAEDKDGLAIEIDPPDTQGARDLMVSLERGDVTQMSFGFRTLEDKWETKDGQDVRTLLKVELFDVSPVTYPAYPDTDVAVRSLQARRERENKATANARAGDFDARRRELDLAETEF